MTEIQLHTETENDGKREMVAHHLEMFVVLMVCVVIQFGSSNAVKSTYQFIFPEGESDPYAKLDGIVTQRLTQFSLCLWWQQMVFNNEHACFFSYLPMNQPTDETIRLGTFEFGKTIYTTNRGFFGNIGHGQSERRWSHVCVTWNEMATGVYGEIFINGRFIKSHNVTNSSPMHLTNGIVILGKRLFTANEEFQQIYQFKGRLSEVHMWDYILSPQNISGVYKCSPNEDGNVLSWNRNNWNLYGGTRVSPVKLPCGQQ